MVERSTDIFSFVINGTPMQFGNMVKSFSQRHYIRGEQYAAYEVTDNRGKKAYDAKIDPVIIWLGRNRILENGRPIGPAGFIVANSLPGDKPQTQLEITVFADKDGDKERHWWNLLKAEMERQARWFDSPKPTETNQSEQQEKPIQKTERPSKRREMTRAYGGLIKWYADASDMSIDNAAAELDMPNSRYYDNPDDIYTEADVTELDTTWGELLEKHKLHVFPKFLKEKLLQKASKKPSKYQVKPE